MPATLGTSERRHRSRARAWILQVHYRWETGGQDSTLREALAQTERTRRIAPQRLPYVRRIVDLLDAGMREVDARLQDALDNWRLERLSAIDRAILRIAGAEILLTEDVPPKASIQEAVRLAEAYGGPDSPRFVNGVLDALYKSRSE